MEGAISYSAAGGGSGFTLSNIGDYKKVEDLYVIGSASLFTLFLSVIAARIGGLGGLTLNTYFDMFGLEGVLSNTMLVTLILQISRYFYTVFYGASGKAWSPFVFICIVLVLQVLHDLLFYYGVINILPSGKNEMVDMLKQYAAENKLKAVGAHSTFLIVTAIVAMVMKDMTDLQQLIIPGVVLYMLPYFLSVVTKKPVPPPPPPKKQETFRDARGFY